MKNVMYFVQSISFSNFSTLPKKYSLLLEKNGYTLHTFG